MYICTRIYGNNEKAFERKPFFVQQIKGFPKDKKRWSLDKILKNY